MGSRSGGVRPGKRACLRLIGSSGQLYRPAEADHPLLHELWREAAGVGFFVRQHYKVLPTDPRWLQLDEHQVVEEAVRLTYHGLHNARTADPLATVLSEPGLLERLTEEQEEIRNDPDFGAMVARTIEAWRLHDNGGEARTAPPTTLRATWSNKTG